VRISFVFLALSIAACSGTKSSQSASTENLSGTWQLTLTVPVNGTADNGNGGVYPAEVVFTQTGDSISGSANWGNGQVLGTITGTVNGSNVTMTRVDTTRVFRGSLDGTVSADGNSMSGTGANDPTVDNGNAATYTWTAERGAAAPVACTGWIAPAGTCADETDGLTYVCNCPGYGGCRYARFADATCTTCSPYDPPQALKATCDYFAPNGETYGPIGSDPRWASCVCADQ
jgi:hypothetical protein